MNLKLITNLFLFFIAVSYSQKITDFRLSPVGTADVDLKIGFSANENQNQYTKLQSLSGITGLNLNGRYESEPKIFSGSLYYYQEIINQQAIDTINQGKSRLSELFLMENLNGDFYFNNSSFFWSIAGKGFLDWHYRNEDSNYMHSIYGNYDAGAGIGFGRLRDGTPAYKAMEIIKLLKREKIIEKEPDREEILKLAQILSQKWCFQLRYERYEKFLFQEIEEYFKSIGIYRIPAYLWFKIKEIIIEETEPREFGFTLVSGFGLMGSGSIYYEVVDGYIYSDMYGNPTEQLRLSLQTAYPLTYRLQVKEALRLYIDENGLSYYNQLSSAYLIFIKLETIISHKWEDYFNQYSQKRMREQSLSLSFQYYLEDRVSVFWDNCIRYHWERERTDWFRNFNTQISFNYDAF